MHFFFLSSFENNLYSKQKKHKYFLLFEEEKFWIKKISYSEPFRRLFFEFFENQKKNLEKFFEMYEKHEFW
jgi:hypothetical protein